MSRDPKAPTPGWHDVLRNIHHGLIFKDGDDAENFAMASANVLTEVVPGLRVIGTMLWTAAYSDNPLEQSEIARVGVLIESLTGLIETMHTNEVNAIAAKAHLDAGLTCFGEPRTPEREAVRQQILAEEAVHA